MKLSQFKSLYQVFENTVSQHSACSFLAVPPRENQEYFPLGRDLQFGEAMTIVSKLQTVYRNAGYGHGHRVALLLDNRIEILLHFLAMNSLGICMVPLNPLNTETEIGFILEHSQVDLAVVLPQHLEFVQRAAKNRTTPLPVQSELKFADIPKVSHRGGGSIDRTTMITLMYTSGTTGKPKACIIDNEYCLSSAQWYNEMGGLLTMGYAQERIINPLPLFHMNSGVVSFASTISMANCLIIPDRFHPSTWWRDVVRTKATAMHYLGIIPTILLKLEPCAEEKSHTLKYGMGNGIDPSIHRQFEERFGFPMVEVWGMTEAGRFIADAFEPRQIDTRTFGRPKGELEVRVADDQGNEVPPGTHGEMLLRCAGENPRRGFFRGYLNDDKTTEEAWRGGWFHTGDVVVRSEDGSLAFVDRRKNIIRRSGENISAAEVETTLSGHPHVARVAVIPIEDELRQEEVMACVVPSKGVERSKLIADELFAHCARVLTYFKNPGWIVFVEDLPTTSTQKVRKGLIFGEGEDPRKHKFAFDLRSMKSGRKKHEK